jgi:hypothetical protein
VAVRVAVQAEALVRAVVPPAARVVVLPEGRQLVVVPLRVVLPQAVEPRPAARLQAARLQAPAPQRARSASRWWPPRRPSRRAST